MNWLLYLLGACAAIQLTLAAKLLFFGAFWSEKWWQTTLALIVGGILFALGVENLVLFISKGVLA